MQTATGAQAPLRNPHDPRPLKPGQRYPTRADLDEAEKGWTGYRGIGFPHSQIWRLNARNVTAWLRHDFADRRGETNHTRTIGDLAADEFYCLLLDLDCWRDMAARSARGLCADPGPLIAYLSHGREGWGWMGALRELWRMMEHGEEPLCSDVRAAGLGLEQFCAEFLDELLDEDEEDDG